MKWHEYWNTVHDFIEFLFKVRKLVRKFLTKDSSRLKFWKRISESKHYLLSLPLKFQTLAKHFLIWETKTTFDFLQEFFSFLFSTQSNLFAFFYSIKFICFLLLNQIYFLSFTPSNPYEFFKFICFMWFHQITISVSSCIIYFGVSVLLHRTWWLAWKLHQWVSIFVLWVRNFKFFSLFLLSFRLYSTCHLGWMFPIYFFGFAVFSPFLLTSSSP